MKKNILTIGLTILFVVSLLSHSVIGYYIGNYGEKSIIKITYFNKYLYPESYDHYNVYEVYNLIEQPNNDRFADNKIRESKVSFKEEPVQSLDGPMDSVWPMYGQNVRNIGRSPYSTANNYGEEKWKFETISWASSSPAIDSDGTVYIGSVRFYAVYPNGTLKWMYKLPGNIETCCPAIDENGIIYIGTIYDLANGNHLYAFFPNGTIKWKFFTGGNIFSSPVIGDDGTIYFGHGDGPNDGHINAVYPNGTLRWRFHASHAIFSSPAIGQDGTIYFGSHDKNVYALYPNNGTLKWKFTTGNWVHGSPTIADDGTIYIGSDDKYLYALFPNNGTLKWKINIGEIFGSAALDKDGTIYAGVWEKRFYALYPNGTVKWSFDTGNGKIWGSSPALSDDGTIYFGTCDLEWTGGIEIIALNTDGTLKWRKKLDTVFSSPAIDKDGTVYIGSCGEDGYLNAIGPLDPDAPSAPTITGKTIGTEGTEYEYKFKSTSPLNKDIYYYIGWGDGSKKDWFGPFGSGVEVTASHIWTSQGTFTIKARAKDTENLWGPWGELTVTMPRDKTISNSLLMRFLERYPLIHLLLQRFVL